MAHPLTIKPAKFCTTHFRVLLSVTVVSEGEIPNVAAGVSLLASPRIINAHFFLNRDCFPLFGQLTVMENSSQPQIKIKLLAFLILNRLVKHNERSKLICVELEVTTMNPNQKEIT